MSEARKTSQPHKIGPAHWVMNAGRCWPRNCPLIPDLVGSCASPHADFNVAASRACDGLLQGEEDWEPAKHIGRVRPWVCTESDIPKQHCFKVASKSMAERSRRIPTLKVQAGMASIVGGKISLCGVSKREDRLSAS